ncbi:MAG TPA: hypothetical protein VKB86_06865 [Pyrinomonadaceae bacterium]|nr:hypothetical protein [Pyrinomonadaceae bacterium]
MKNIRKMLGGAILTFAVIFGLSASTNMTAHAQYRVDRDDYYQRQREYQRERQERERERERAYRNNQYGYGNNGYGNNGYGNYGYNNYGYGNNGYNNAYRVEMSQGYQYGVNVGASDAQRGQSYSPQRSHYWRDANSQAFRDGFVQGYDQGYRQYAGYQRNRTGSVWGRILGLPY